MLILLLTLALASSYAHPDLLVDTDWLAVHLNDPGIRIVDMRRGDEIYAAGHIPNAVYLDPVAIRDAKNAPTFLPRQESFEAMMGKLGISNRTRVIVYDERGGIYAARLWWILNYFGHSNVALLNGGWIKWAKEGRPSKTEAPSRPDMPVRVVSRVELETTFTARPNPRWLATASDVVAAIDKPGVKIVDARTQAEIDGKDLRGIRRGGFVPSSTPVYWEDLLDPEVKTFRPAADLEQIFKARGILPSDEVIAYCQVGMRASVDLFALHLVGYDKLRNYLGSWEEWGNRDDLPIGTKQ